MTKNWRKQTEFDVMWKQAEVLACLSDFHYEIVVKKHGLFGHKKHTWAQIYPTMNAKGLHIRRGYDEAVKLLAGQEDFYSLPAALCEHVIKWREWQAEKDRLWYEREERMKAAFKPRVVYHGEPFHEHSPWIADCHALCWRMEGERHVIMFGAEFQAAFR